MYCAECHLDLRESARFCDRCGVAVSQDSECLAETLPRDPFIGRVLDSKYELIERIGKGGMGVVYRARRIHIRDHVAVKLLLPQFVSDKTMLMRFRQEAVAAAKLHHPNIVTIHDVGETQGEEPLAYIVMELLEGTSLRELLQSEDRLPAERAVSLMQEICSGVGAAHGREIVHRDLKPENIIVLPPKSYFQHESVKVVDFGIAKLRDNVISRNITQPGHLIGTYYYMSPEQCRGEELDARSDIYSLGVMLYEMLTGVRPFMAETGQGIITQHLFQEPPPVAAQFGVPEILEAAIVSALAKEREVRPKDAVAFARNLTAG